jgi:hypothetical protein
MGARMTESDVTAALSAVEALALIGGWDSVPEALGLEVECAELAEPLAEFVVASMREAIEDDGEDYEVAAVRAALTALFSGALLGDGGWIGPSPARACGGRLRAARAERCRR